jgi:hypothetical protein
MHTLTVRLLVIVLLGAGTARAQTPSGTITGTTKDPAGAVLAGVHVTITHRETGQSRKATSSADGSYSAAVLRPGEYHVTAHLDGFKRVEKTASVEAGTTTSVDLTLELGTIEEMVTVPGAQPLIRPDDHIVGGVVTRGQIEALPLNGRTFLELTKLEPGTTNPSRFSDGRVFVAPLGAGLNTIPRVGNTRVTVDGANITTPGTSAVLLQISQDVVQEFQISTANFDQATSLTTSGAINVVTRSGGNKYQASGVYVHRDHNLAAYPALRRDPRNPDPYFRRRQAGAYVGGPLVRDRAFLFAAYEGTDQQGVVSVQPSTPAFAHLGGIFPSPYVENQVSARGDVHLHRNHQLFGRYTYDGSHGHVGGASVLPSGWVRRANKVDQSLVALTSVLTDRVVNDLRISYFSVDSPIRPPTASDCAGCFGLGEARIAITDVGLTFGQGATGSSVSERYQLTESLVWQKGNHQLQFGFDWEHTTAIGSSVSQDPADITLWAPGRVVDPSIPRPSTFTTVDDFLQLPLRSFSTSVGPTSPLWSGFREQRVIDLYRLFVSDTWRAAPRLTMSFGLGWSYEPNALNHDLTKPALIAPILGPQRLNPPSVQTRNFSPTVGFAWTATRDGRTVVRGGAGRYFDPIGGAHPLNLINERHLLSPLGNGRFTVTGLNILHDGRPLDFPQPTTFTGAHLLSILPSIRADLLGSLNPENRDFSVRNIDLTKQGQNLSDPSVATPYALHASLGVQRELTANFVVGADFVWKRFIHAFINGIDYNRWVPGQGDVPTTAVIPPCTVEERNDVGAVCSNGRMFFDTTSGRARYQGLLLRAEKRFSNRTQFLVSYALASFVGSNGTGTGTSEAPGGRVFGFNNDDWFENYGSLPTDQRHVLNVSGLVELPWRLQLAASIAAYSAPPFAAYVAGVDFNGDGTRDDLLPGTRVNQFGRGLDKDDLVRLVDAYNQQFALKRTAGGQIAPLVTLPVDFSFYDGFFTQDVRVTRTFPLGSGRARVSAFVEVFNLFNTANLVGHSSNLVDRAFGQPNARVSQVLGSGGPRVIQLGARFTF